MSRLPPRLVTSIVWSDDGVTDSTFEGSSSSNSVAKSTIEHLPDVALPVFEYDPTTEEAVHVTEDELLSKFMGASGVTKRPRLVVQSTPGAYSTPGTTAADDEDDSASVGSRAEASTSKKWPFEEVKGKLLAAAVEMRVLAEVLKSKGTTLVRVERVPQSADEAKTSLQLGELKRTEAFKKSEDLLKKGAEQLEKEIRNQRDFVGKLDRISEKWKIIAPGHSKDVFTSLKPEEPLAISLETGESNGSLDDVVLIRRCNPAHGGISFSSVDGKNDDSFTDFRVHGVIAKLISLASPNKVLGQASTSLASVEVDQGDNNDLSIVVVDDHHVSLDNRIEARFKDAYARSLIRRLSQSDNEIRLGKEAVLKFELVPDEKPFSLINSNDAICSAALNLLERGKGADTIRIVCLQKLVLPKFMDVLNKTPGASAVVWKTDEDDEDIPENIQCRCCIDVGRSGKHAMEFVLSRGELRFDWSTIPGYKPKLARALEPDEALEIASEIAMMALVKDLMSMVSEIEPDSITRVKPDSFQVENKSAPANNFMVKAFLRQGKLAVVLAFQDPVKPERDISAHPFRLLRLFLIEQRKPVVAGAHQ